MQKFHENKLINNWFSRDVVLGVSYKKIPILIQILHPHQFLLAQRLQPVLKVVLMDFQTLAYLPVSTVVISITIMTNSIHNCNKLFFPVKYNIDIYDIFFNKYCNSFSHIFKYSFFPAINKQINLSFALKFKSGLCLISSLYISSSNINAIDTLVSEIILSKFFIFILSLVPPKIAQWKQMIEPFHALDVPFSELCNTLLPEYWSPRHLSFHGLKNLLATTMTFMMSVASVIIKTTTIGWYAYPRASFVEVHPHTKLLLPGPTNSPHFTLLQKLDGLAKESSNS
uniref:Uncharacterized protein n=1 Tax=Heterorhabditis bacteriophora TaxID=37862 RepID=A0A1I7WQ09_HETBA